MAKQVYARTVQVTLTSSEAVTEHSVSMSAAHPIPDDTAYDTALLALPSGWADRDNLRVTVVDEETGRSI